MQHPLTDLLVQYVKDFPQLKSDNVDSDNLSFNNQYGLFIQPPINWPLNDAIGVAIQESEFNSIVVVYPSTKVYNELSHLLGEQAYGDISVEYFPWHEMYTAMNRVNEDARYLQQLKKMLSESDLVLFVGSGGVPPDVVNQITASCSGCFIRIGRQG